MKFDLQLLQWAYTALAAPLFGWLGGWMHSRRKAEQTRKARISYLSGLPEECKCELLYFKLRGTHTMRGDPGHPAMRLLTQKGIVGVGPGGGTYDAVDSYLSVHQAYWSVLDRWILKDPVAVELMQEIAAEMQQGGDEQ